jgi:DNA-binding NarL/FixJ family response regulator
LSDREFHVMKLLAEGKTISDIAEMLSLSPTTISTYRARIMEKMKMKANAELARYALENRLI